MSDTRWDINPGTPDTPCTCPSMDNGRGRRTDERWVIVEGCPLHWPTAELVEDAVLLAVAEERMARDTGERYSLDSVIEEFGGSVGGEE